jgi:hypothetical protein
LKGYKVYGRAGAGAGIFEISVPISEGLTLLHFGFNHEKFTPPPLRETTQKLLEGGGVMVFCFVQEIDFSLSYFYLFIRVFRMNYGDYYCGYHNQNKEWRTGIIMNSFVHFTFKGLW